MARNLSLFATAVAVVVFSSSAQAGFEWKGPLSAPAKPSSAAQAPAQGDMSGLEPVVMWDGQNSPAISWNQEVAMPAEKVGDVEKTQIGQNLSPAETAALPAPAYPLIADTGEEVSGFGADLPLVIALQQVVPAGYQFSFSTGVNPGVLVSWEGGKSWGSVLADMLSTQGLGYRIRNNAVVIGYFKSDEQSTTFGSATAAASDGMNMKSAAVTQASSEPVTIRRQKPSSLLRRQAEKEAVAATEPVVEPRTVSSPQPLVAAAAINKPISIIDAPQAAPQQPAAPDWSGAKGQTLRDVLKNWSEVAGVELYWSIDYDYRLSEDAAYPGTYDEAVGKLLDRFATVRPQPYGQLHQNGDNPRVLVVKSYDLTK